MLELRPLKNIFHKIQAYIAVKYYGDPGRKISIIGVTGTDGKTTTSTLIYHILISSDRSASLVSTVSARVAGTQFDTGFHTTTPSSFLIQKFLKKAVEAKNSYFILETTSHALDQNRVWGILFSIGVVTNITHEHLYYHKKQSNYIRAKAKLLESSKIAIINHDDASYNNLIELVEKSNKNEKVYSYGLKQNSDFHVEIGKKIGVSLPRFNSYNYLAAYAACKLLGLTDDEIFSGMKTFIMPAGRMEIVYNGLFKVIVDFAHTPNALYEALSAVKMTVKKGKLIHIFGAAAFRDDGKRFPMGVESGTFADSTILTEEDYRTEDPNKICREIARGLEEKGFTYVPPESYFAKRRTYTIVIDRALAIKKAFSVTRGGDTVILTGKGHEQSLCRGKTEFPWNDGESVISAINELGIKTPS